MNPFKSNDKQLGIFTTAGFPHKNSLLEVLPKIENHGGTFVEVGIPFSDPMADGPIIQHSSNVALNNGMNLDLIFDQLEQIKLRIPKVMMGYINPVLSYGMEHFLQRCQKNNITGIILPDLPYEIYQLMYEKLFAVYNQKPIFIISPTTSNERIVQLAEVCKNSFLYLTSQNSITGADKKDTILTDRYREIKQLVRETPLFIGFGIKSKEDVQSVHTYADGAIIGSAFIQALEANLEEEYLSSLLKESFLEY